MSAVLPSADEGLVRSRVGERREGGRRESLEISRDGGRALQGRPYVEYRYVKGHFGGYVDYYKEMDEVSQHYEDEK